MSRYHYTDKYLDLMHAIHSVRNSAGLTPTLEKEIRFFERDCDVILETLSPIIHQMTKDAKMIQTLRDLIKQDREDLNAERTD